MSKNTNRTFPRPFYFHRFDDMGPIESTEKSVLSYMVNHQIPAILAVIPGNLSKSSFSDFKKENNFSIFQHGFNHVNRNSSGHPDEFPDGLSESRIKREISVGKRILEDFFEREVLGYVPPWNINSLKTIHIIEELGFRIFSSRKIFKAHESRLLQLPIEFDMVKKYGSPNLYKNILDISKEIRDFPSFQCSFLGIMYHFHDFQEQDLDTIKALMGMLLPQTIPLSRIFSGL